MTDLAQHCADIGKAAADRLATTYISRDWWIVRTVQGDVPVFFCPPQTQVEVLTRWYPGCGVVPGQEG